MKQPSQFRRNELSLSLLLALGVAVPGAALATGLPGAGTVTVGNVASTTGTSKGGITGTVIAGMNGATTLTVTGNSVVQWGGPATSTAVVAESKATAPNAPGFSIAGGQTLTVAGTKAGLSLLNVDASGNASTIAGTLTASGTKGVNIFIANANGVTVAPGGVISAPVIGLIGADLASTTMIANVIQANAAQTAFAAGKNVDIAYAAGGDIDVLGGLNNNVGGVPAAAATVLLAGSTSVNVEGSSISATALNIYGGVGGTVTNAGVYTPDMGAAATGIPAAHAYAATNVSVANASPTVVLADGNLAFSGFSALPTAVGSYGWTGVLSNTGTLNVGAVVKGQSTKSVYLNPWFNTAGPGGTFLQTPVGSIDNSGTITSTGGTFDSNGFTNTGKILVGNGNGLTVSSSTGDINLGGTVAASKANSAISFADLATITSGAVNVSAPLTISGTNVGGTAGTSATFNVDAAGAVSLTGALSLTDANAAGARGTTLYSVTGSGITIGANQTVSNSNAANTMQPMADLFVNSPGQAVSVNSGSTLTAGDFTIGAPAAPAALTVNGSIVATNSGYNAYAAGKNGSITAYATGITGTGSMTGQQFTLQYTGDFSNGNSPTSSPYYKNSFLLNSAGSNPTVNLLESGSGHQYTNVMVNGNVTLNASSSTASFTPGAFLSGTGAAAQTLGNAGSPVILLSSGNIVMGQSSQLLGNGTAGGGLNTAAMGASGIGDFWVPGLLGLGNANSATNPTAVNAAGTITSVGDVYNDYLAPVAGGKGMWFLTRNLNITGSLFTNMNSNVNFLTQTALNQYRNSVYQVQYSPSVISNTLNVSPNPYAVALVP
ncbi:MAG: beta strand repeat-containing protein [Acidithiobacillus ferrooxidans]